MINREKKDRQTQVDKVSRRMDALYNALKLNNGIFSLLFSFFSGELHNFQLSSYTIFINKIKVIP